MNTKDTPFALSFGNYGDPRRYMGGPSPAKKIEAAAAKIKNSPLANLAGIFLADGGGSASLKPIPAPALGQGVSVPSAPSVGINPNAMSGTGIAPGSFQIPNLVLPQISDFNAAPQVGDTDGDGQIDNFWGIQTTTPTSSVDVNNRTDFNPLAPDTSNQFAVSGNDYQKTPGFGKLQKAVGQLMGMG
jgi:hypothetical protein